MEKIQGWIYNLLVNLGLIKDSSSYLDNIVILFLIIIVTVGIDYSCQSIVLGAFKRLARRTKNQWDDLIVDRKIINKMMHLIPALLIYIMLPFAFPAAEMPVLLSWLEKLCAVYIIAVLLRFGNSSLLLLHDIYDQKGTFKHMPLRGFVQLLQVILFFIGGILIIAIMINKSPISLLAGLGASAAVLMLVFKDTILGFVAGIQLSANNMLSPGDWITMDKYGANGIVIEVTLNAVKVQNFDNTITTIPPYALVSDSFQNWRGMRESGGRRIKRSINIDMNSITFCSQEQLEVFRQMPLLNDYLEAFVEKGKRLTNLGVFRAYLNFYMRSLPDISKQMACMVRHLQPTESGLPLEIYCFSTNKEWVGYEMIQADLFEYVLATLPVFGLRVFQDVSGADIRSLKTIDK